MGTQKCPKIIVKAVIEPFKGPKCQFNFFLAVTVWTKKGPKN